MATIMLMDNLVKLAAKRNKENAKKAPPLITGTAALTKGTYAAKTKVFGVGAEYSSSSNEHDIFGVRDNKKAGGEGTDMGAGQPSGSPSSTNTKH